MQSTTPCPATNRPSPGHVPDHIKVGDLPLSVAPCTAEELGQQAVQLVPIAQRVVGAVHLDGPAAIRQLLEPLDTQQLSALVVVLAAMVDLEASPSQLLAWVTWDDPTYLHEAARTASTVRRRRPTRQQLEERRDQVVALTGAGMAARDIAARLGVKAQTVKRDRAARGLPAEDQPAAGPPAAPAVTASATPAAAGETDQGQGDQGQEHAPDQVVTETVAERGCAA